MINIYELTKIHKKKQETKINIFNKILVKCHNKIHQTVKINKTNCFYKVPPFLFGSPLYNQDACIAHILMKLKKNGFDVKFKHPNIIFISWEKYNYDNYDKSNIQNNKSCNKIKNNTANFDQGPGSTSYITKFYKELNEKYLL